MRVKAPVEKNFRRPRVKPGKRKGGSGRAWLSWRAVRILAGLAVIGFAAVRAADLVASASTLQVRHIEVHGNVRLSAGEVKAIMNGLRGSNILLVDLDRYRDRLLESNWVARAALRRVLPSSVEVFVEERRPVGLCRLNGELHLVDREGMLIDQFGPQYAEFDLPIIDGLVRPPAGGGPIIDPARAALAGRLIDAVSAKQTLASRLSQVDVSDVQNAVVLLDGDPALLHVGTERFAERLQAYVELAPAFREQFPEIDYVDLRFEERFYVRPAGRDQRTRPSQGSPAPAGRRF